jgi:hypothetical protein
MFKDLGSILRAEERGRRRRKRTEEARGNRSLVSHLKSPRGRWTLGSVTASEALVFLSLCFLLPC